MTVTTPTDEDLEIAADALHAAALILLNAANVRLEHEGALRRRLQLMRAEAAEAAEKILPGLY